MRIPRIHTAQPLHGLKTVVLEAGPSSHLVKVLRLKPDNRCILFNGDGRDYHCHVEAADKRAARLAIDSSTPNLNESRLQLTLIQSLVRGDRMDYLLQKSVELGVSRIMPVLSEFTNIRIPAERVPRRLAHWRQILVSACEQCGRSTLPELMPPTRLEAALRDLPQDAHRLLLQPDAARGTGSVPENRRFVLLVGPEGGFSQTEAEMIQQHEFTAMRLGARILRTETAALAAISALQALYGDFR